MKRASESIGFWRKGGCGIFRKVDRCWPHGMASDQSLAGQAPGSPASFRADHPEKTGCLSHSLAAAPSGRSAPKSSSVPPRRACETMSRHSQWIEKPIICRTIQRAVACGAAERVDTAWTPISHAKRTKRQFMAPYQPTRSAISWTVA